MKPRGILPLGFCVVKRGGDGDARFFLSTVLRNVHKKLCKKTLYKEMA